MASLVQISLFAVFSAAALYLAIDDHRNNRLSNFITLPLAISGLVANSFDTFVPFFNSLAGALAGFSIIQVLRLLQKWSRGSTGIGFGDAKLLGALGAWLGLLSVPILLFGAALFMLIIYPKRKFKPFGVGLITIALGIFGLRIAGNS